MLLDRLKEETRGPHRQIERSLNLFGKASSPERYAEVLACLLGFYAPLEERLARFDWDGLGLAYAPRRKAELLLRDLAQLGYRGTVLACPAEQLPGLQTLGKALGCLYVLEGATLGGRVIARHFSQRFGLSPERGLAFHTAYGDITDAMWQTLRLFASDLSSHRASPVFDDDAVAGAIEAFTALSWWLDHVSVAKHAEPGIRLPQELDKGKGDKDLEQGLRTSGKEVTSA